MNAVKSKRFTVPILRSFFYVVGGPDAGSCVKALPEEMREAAQGIFDESPMCDGQTLWSEKLCATAVIFVFPKNKDCPVQDTVSHECVHAAGHILEMHRVYEHPDKTPEMLAYLTGWCADTVAGVFKKGKK